MNFNRVIQLGTREHQDSLVDNGASTTPDCPSSILEPHVWEDRTNSPKLPSALYICLLCT